MLNINGFSFRFGVGGADKKDSSILETGLLRSHTERSWGYYKVLHNEMGVVKVKELVVIPAKHFHAKTQAQSCNIALRKGVATVYTLIRKHRL